MKSKLIAALCLLVPAVAGAQSMNAQAFYDRASALQSKGPLALFSSDLKVLTNEAKAAAGRARQQRLAAVAAGHKPRYCPPDGPGSLGDKEFMARLSAIPAADRAHIDMTEAMTRILAGKFPCRA